VDPARELPGASELPRRALGEGRNPERGPRPGRLRGQLQRIAVRVVIATMTLTRSWRREKEQVCLQEMWGETLVPTEPLTSPGTGRV